MNIFEMTQTEFDNWIESPEGLEFIENFANYVANEMDKDEFFCAKECWKWDCQYNSHYGDDEGVELGHYTVCHKFRNNEENDCLERVTWLYDKKDGE